MLTRANARLCTVLTWKMCYRNKSVVCTVGIAKRLKLTDSVFKSTVFYINEIFMLSLKPSDKPWTETCKLVNVIPFSFELVIAFSFHDLFVLSSLTEMIFDNVFGVAALS